VSDVYPETPLGSPPGDSLARRVGVPSPLQPGPAPATPGQRAYEARCAATVLPAGHWRWAWGKLDDATRAAEEAGAQAAIAAAELTWDADLKAERDDARAAFAKLAAHFTQGKQSGWTARISGTVLRRLCTAAMCEPPSGLPADPFQPSQPEEPS